MMLACAACAATSANAIEVLLLWDDSPDTPIPVTPTPPLITSLNLQTQGFVAALEAEGFNVILSDRTQYDYNGNNPAPDAFDVIVHLNGNTNPDETVFGTSTKLQGSAATKVKNYIFAGGGYVGSENNGLQVTGIGGTGIIDFAPIEFRPVQGPNDGALEISFSSSHPVLAGLTSPFTINGTFLATQLRDYSPSLDLAEELATDAEGNTAVAVRPLGDGRVVAFHHRGNYGGPNTISNTLSDANVRTLYINAIRWADQTPPKVQAITVDGPPATNAATATFLVTFTESVTGVDAADFSISGVTTVPTPVVTPVSAKQYQVTVSGIVGAGLLSLDLIDNDSIVDDSSNNTSLASASGADGSFTTGDDVLVDRIAPSVQSVSTIPFPAATDTTPVIALAFDETMKNSIAPAITVTTANNGPIATFGGTWVGSTYQVTLARVLTNADAGPVTITASGAEDLLGNVMNAYAAAPIAFEPIGLTATLSLSGSIARTVGETVTLEVELAGLTGPPHYDWKKDTGAKAVFSVGSDSPQLVLSNLTFADSADYYCVVTDDVSQTQTPTVQLQVVAALPLGGSALLAALAALSALGGATLRRKRG